MYNGAVFIPDRYHEEWTEQSSAAPFVAIRVVKT
jgi:hypothetical protein